MSKEDKSQDKKILEAVLKTQEREEEERKVKENPKKYTAINPNTSGYQIFKEQQKQKDNSTYGARMSTAIKRRGSVPDDFEKYSREMDEIEKR